MRHLITCAAISALSLIAVTGALAASKVGSGGATQHSVTTLRPTTTTPTTGQPTSTGPAHTGQPNQSCGSATAPNTPGSAAAAPGSAFNPNGQAGTVYAGQQPQNSRNTASVSQYDVGCSKQPSR